MPFRSRKQVRYLYANNPEVAKRWEDKYGIPHDLPESATGLQGQLRKKKHHPKKRRRHGEAKRR